MSRADRVQLEESMSRGGRKRGSWESERGLWSIVHNVQVLIELPYVGTFIIHHSSITRGSGDDDDDDDVRDTRI